MIPHIVWYRHGGRWRFDGWWVRLFGTLYRVRNDNGWTMYRWMK